MVNLDHSFSIKGLTLKNRIVMAPMCQYSVEKEDGKPNDWHFVHYVSRAVGGVGLILIEMTDVEPNGRITNNDLGLWTDEQIPAFKKIIDEVHRQGAKIGIQIAHAGRKAQDTEESVGATNQPIEDGVSRRGVPRALTTEEVGAMVDKYKDAARRAVEAGVDTIEIHGAHGYLIHQFISPLVNTREDQYGQDLARFPVEVIKAVKSVMPDDMPLLMRLSAIEYVENGYDIQHSLEIAKKCQEAGVDVFHISSGGEGTPGTLKPGNYPGYQVPMARKYREMLNVPVIAVGKLESPELAEAVIANQDADLVAIGRGLLDDPYWGIHALKKIGKSVVPPKQYERGIR